MSERGVSSAESRQPISTRELNYVRNHLSWELLMAKKCREHAANIVEPKYQQLVNDIGTKPFAPADASTHLVGDSAILR
ncbi:MAG: hypothetical protein HPY55_06150 [Firmicutes bacterium]|nr:hypothetical protein [Bacillota bacterium]